MEQSSCQEMNERHHLQKEDRDHPVEKWKLLQLKKESKTYVTTLTISGFKSNKWIDIRVSLHMEKYVC